MKETTTSPNNHNTFWLLIAFGIITIILGFKYVQLQKNKEIIDDLKKEKLYDKQREQDYNKRNSKHKPITKKQQKAIYYMASKERVEIKRKKVVKDTSFMVAKRLKIVMHKRYYMSIVENDDLPVLSISRGYSFTYNKVKKDNSKSLTEQWFYFRKQLAPKIKYTDVKKFEYEGMKIEEKNFYIPGKRKVYGVSKLIEIGEERYFFHYTFKQEFEDYHMLRKYLNYYVKIK